MCTLSGKDLDDAITVFRGRKTKIHDDICAAFELIREMESFGWLYEMGRKYQLYFCTMYPIAGATIPGMWAVEVGDTQEEAIGRCYIKIMGGR